jgi:hypothetical protein
MAVLPQVQDSVGIHHSDRGAQYVSIGYTPAKEAEANYHRQLASQATTNRRAIQGQDSTGS